ncbi:MAG: response regulator [Fibromonadaceae bacterium]|jgi:CheY-like chemotaxis protein/two-component sensor histidine kinase|nr:response regulator [Fibromonadaceae bacterium]
MHSTEEYEALRKELENERREKDKLTREISYEIRASVNAITGITETEMDKEGHPKETLDSFRRIYSFGYSLLNTINDVLDLSKIERGELEITPVKYDIASLINDTIQLNLMRLGNKSIKFALLASEDLPAYMIGDDLRIKQILNNLLSNAFKYTDKGSVSLEFKSKLDGEKVHLIITVRDTGQGMNAEQVSLAEEGTTLGLSIVKKFTELMQGSITVESELGKGSAFTVEILQQAVECPAIGKELAENLQNFNFFGEKQMKKTQIVREYMPYGSVLVVDDIESNLFMAKSLLKPYGLKIETAGSGFEAIGKVRRGASYDIIFMDHMMPKMDGIETVKRLLEAGYNKPIVALTANAIAGQEEIYIKNGFVGLIPKPVDIRRLNNVLNKFIRDKQEAEVLEAARRQKVVVMEPAFESASQKAALLAIFSNDAKKTLPIIEAVFKNLIDATDEDLRLFTVNVHAMKSALANVGEEEASKLAASLERAARAQDRITIRTETQDFINSLETIIAKIDSQAAPNASIDADLPYLRKQMQIISKACIEYDELTAGASLTSLQNMPWTKETKATIDKISEALLFSDFEKAQKIAESLA